MCEIKGMPDREKVAWRKNQVLVTGAVGFIGMHLCISLLKRGVHVVGVDSVNAYYDPALKEARAREIESVARESEGSFMLVRANLATPGVVEELFEGHVFEVVFHLAAQAGVRYSLEAPLSYVESNVVAFTHLLEGCRKYGVKHLVYASSSSVYGLNSNVPYREDSATSHPASLYAATKKSNELFAHVYSHLYGIATTGLRFFTVYGPWGRPDMSPHLFTQAMLRGEPLRVFNYGHMLRDFTYIDDIVAGMLRIAEQVPQCNDAWDACDDAPCQSRAPYRIYNIGHGTPVSLEEFIDTLGRALGVEPKKEYLPMQPGDVHQTHSDTHALEEAVGYRAPTDLKAGLARFVEWYLAYYGAQR